MLGMEERAASKREALRTIFSKVFLAKVTLCVIATTSLTTSVLNFGYVQCINRQYRTFEHKDYMTRIDHAYERLTKDDDARMAWAELSRQVGSAAFLKSYYLAFFVGLICK
jgi:hypothetical protein